MYKLVFTPDELSRQRFEICHQAILLTNKEVNSGNEDDFIALLRKFKSISEPDKNNPKNKLRDLKDEGGIVQLERSERKLLLECIKAPIWKPVILEEKRDCQDWVENTPETVDISAPDAKPEEVRRGRVQGAPVTLDA